jgi:hypothetical protein
LVVVLLFGLVFRLAGCNPPPSLLLFTQLELST